jgi:adenine specific DNA methylase Mod
LKKAQERTDSVIEKWKLKALESESNLRRVQKKYQDTQSVLNITQNNLDLALDAGALRFRKLLKARIEAESARAAA